MSRPSRDDEHTTPERNQGEAGSLLSELTDLSDGAQFHVGWSLVELPSGRGAAKPALSRHADRRVPAASTRKVAVLMAALAAVESGRLRLDLPVTLDERYRDRVRTGTLQRLSPGLTLSLRDVLTLMIVWSDNLCTAHVIDLVGLDAVNDLCGRLGLTRTRHRHALIPDLPADHPVEATNHTTPSDQARLLTALAQGAAGDSEAAHLLGCSTSLCRFGLDVMAGQQHRDALPALLPPDVTVAHKTGVGWRDVSDIGIFSLHGEPAYVLTVFTDQVPPVLGDGRPGTSDARTLISRVSHACWRALSGPPAPTGL